MQACLIFSSYISSKLYSTNSMGPSLVNFVVVVFDSELSFWKINSFFDNMLSSPSFFFFSAMTVKKVKISNKNREKPSRHLSLTLSWRRPLSYRNQSIDLWSKLMDWFPYDNGLRHERVKLKLKVNLYFPSFLENAFVSMK